MNPQSADKILRCIDCIHDEWDACDDDEYESCKKGHEQLLSGVKPDDCMDYSPAMWGGNTESFAQMRNNGR